MNLLTEFKTNAIIKSNKLKFNTIYIVENLSTYQLIEIDNDNMSRIYFNKKNLRLFDGKSNFVKDYHNNNGFTLENLFNLILDFENQLFTNGFKLNNYEFNGLIWNSDFNYFQILWN